MSLWCRVLTSQWPTAAVGKRLGSVWVSFSLCLFLRVLSACMCFVCLDVRGPVPRTRVYVFSPLGDVFWYSVTKRNRW